MTHSRQLKNRSTTATVAKIYLSPKPQLTAQTGKYPRAERDSAEPACQTVQSFANNLVCICPMCQQQPRRKDCPTIKEIPQSILVKRRRLNESGCSHQINPRAHTNYIISHMSEEKKRKRQKDMMHEIDGAKQPTSQTSYWSRYFMARRHGTFARGLLHTGGKGIGVDPSFVTEGSEVSAANGNAMVLLAASDRRHPVEPPVLQFLLVVLGCGRTRN